jgi:hypothetical protein
VPLPRAGSASVEPLRAAAFWVAVFLFKELAAGAVWAEATSASRAKPNKDKQKERSIVESGKVRTGQHQPTTTYVRKTATEDSSVAVAIRVETRARLALRRDCSAAASSSGGSARQGAAIVVGGYAVAHLVDGHAGRYRQVGAGVV